MKDKRNEPVRIPEDLLKKLRASANPPKPLGSLEKFDISHIPEKKVPFSSDQFPGLRDLQKGRSQATPKSSQGDLGFIIVLFVVWTIWKIYTVWPIIVSFTNTGLEFFIKLAWLGVAWVMPIALLWREISG